MSDVFDGIIVGAAAAAIGTIIAFKFLNREPTGGGTPMQIAAYSPTARSGILAVETPEFSDSFAAPLAQNSPITEAAFNQQLYSYVPAFGQSENQPAEEAVLLQ